MTHQSTHTIMDLILAKKNADGVIQPQLINHLQVLGRANSGTTLLGELLFDAAVTGSPRRGIAVASEGRITPNPADAIITNIEGCVRMEDILDTMDPHKRNEAMAVHVDGLRDFPVSLGSTHQEMSLMLRVWKGPAIVSTRLKQPIALTQAEAELSKRKAVPSVLAGYTPVYITGNTQVLAQDIAIARHIHVVVNDMEFKVAVDLRRACIRPDFTNRHYLRETNRLEANEPLVSALVDEPVARPRWLKSSSPQLKAVYYIEACWAYLEDTPKSVHGIELPDYKDFVRWVRQNGIVATESRRHYHFLTLLDMFHKR